MLTEGSGASLPRRFVLGLCCYTRQAALSLDRAGIEYRAEMHQFLKEHGAHMPGTVLERLLAQSGVPGQSGLFARTKGLFRRNWIWIPGKTLTYVAAALRDYDLLLHDIDAGHERRAAVRLQLSYSDLEVCCRLPRELRRQSETVEYVGQHLDTNVSLESIAGADWLESDHGLDSALPSTRRR